MSGVAATSDPATLDWAALELPIADVDRYDLRRPDHLLTVLGRVLARRRRPVQLPADLPGRETIPAYVLQEFHNLPNGNFSRRLTRGYLTGFDRVMLGSMTRARARLAEQLSGCAAVLDAGCAGGKTARALRQAGVPEVWGLDPSPYMLQHAAQEDPAVRLVQGVAEATGFPDGRFDGIAACFLMHELPPSYGARALAEFWRILRPGGLLALCEPAPLQVRRGVGRLFVEHGLRGAYFGLLARWVHEPFLAAWHESATPETFEAHGFECVEDEHGLPLRHVLLAKPLSEEAAGRPAASSPR